MIEILTILNIVILIYFGLLALYYTILLIGTFPDLIHHFRENEYSNMTFLLEEVDLVPVSIIMAAYNEEHRIHNAIDSVFNSSYKKIELIVVSDASTDNTVQMLIDRYNMYEIPPVVKKTIPAGEIYHYYISDTHPITVIDKEHGGTADSVNVGINSCRTPLYATVDADTVLEPDAITRIVFTFLANPHCIVAGGSVYVLNDNEIQEGQFVRNPKLPKNMVAGMQACEYLRSFLFFRCGWNRLGGALCYAGAFTVFEKQVVEDVGGHDAGNFAHDAEIVMKLHEHMRKNRYPYTAHFVPAAFAWTEVPGTLKQFWNQRIKWQRGLLRSVFLHFRMCLNPRYGATGLLNFPTFFGFEIIGGFMEFIAYLSFMTAIILSIKIVPETIIFIFIAWFYMSFLTAACVLISVATFDRYNQYSDIWRILTLTFVELVGFRQFHVLARVMGGIEYCFNRLRGKPL